MLGGMIMIVGAVLQTASVSYAMLVVARIITGIGNVRHPLPLYKIMC